MDSTWHRHRRPSLQKLALWRKVALLRLRLIALIWSGGSNLDLKLQCPRTLRSEPLLFSERLRLGAAGQAGAVNVRSALRCSHSVAGLQCRLLASNTALARLPQSARSGRLCWESMHLKTSLISILACVLIGGAIAAVSSVRWPAATCFVMAALLINGAIAEWEDSSPGGFNNPDGSEEPAPTGPIWVTFAMGVVALLAGAWLQLG